MRIAKYIRLGIALVGALANSQAASAAKITWGSPQLITGNSDVSTLGTSVYAYNVGDGVTPVANGVTFSPAVTNSGFDYVDSQVTVHNYIYYNGFGAPDAVTSGSNYANMLTSAGYAPGPHNAMGLTLLVTSGHTYQVELWANDPRGSQFYSTEALSDPSGGAGTLTIGQAYASGSGGSWVTGTFTADGFLQSITLDSAKDSQLNGFQLRDITPVPEPTSALVLGMGTIGLFARRRRIS